MDPLSNQVRAWPRHIHEMGQCMRGARAIAESLGLDYNRFVHEGLPVDELRATENAFAIALADWAEKEACSGPEQ